MKPKTDTHKSALEHIEMLEAENEKLKKRNAPADVSAAPTAAGKITYRRERGVMDIWCPLIIEAIMKDNYGNCRLLKGFTSYYEVDVDDTDTEKIKKLIRNNFEPKNT